MQKVPGAGSLDHGRFSGPVSYVETKASAHRLGVESCWKHLLELRYIMLLSHSSHSLYKSCNAMLFSPF